LRVSRIGELEIKDPLALWERVREREIKLCHCEHRAAISNNSFEVRVTSFEEIRKHYQQMEYVIPVKTGIYCLAGRDSITFPALIDE